MNASIRLHMLSMALLVICCRADPSWTTITNAYYSMELPIPSPESQLVITRFGNNKYAAFCELIDSNRCMRLLVGTDFVVSSKVWNVVQYIPSERDFPLGTTINCSPALNPFDANVALGFAVQCYCVGMTNLATKTIREALKHDSGWSASNFHTPADCEPLEAVYRLGWVSWGNRLFDTRTPRKIILQRMNAILHACLALRTTRNERFLQQLKETVESEEEIGMPDHNATPIDELLILGFPPSEDPSLRMFVGTERMETVQKLVMSKDVALDQLLKRHLGDQRLTRVFTFGRMNQPSRCLTIGEMSEYIIAQRLKQTDQRTSESHPDTGHIQTTTGNDGR